MRDFSEYCYQSTLERELALDLCRLWALAERADEQRAELLAQLNAALGGLVAEQLEACRQALRRMRREQELAGDAARPAPAAAASSGPTNVQGSDTAVGDGDTEAETALAALPWDENVTDLQFGSLQERLAELGFGATTIPT